jgi:hypothetical protein
MARYQFDLPTMTSMIEQLEAEQRGPQTAQSAKGGGGGGGGEGGGGGDGDGGGGGGTRQGGGQGQASGAVMPLLDAPDARAGTEGRAVVEECADESQEWAPAPGAPGEGGRLQERESEREDASRPGRSGRSSPPGGAGLGAESPGMLETETQLRRGDVDRKILV